jgi:hypothetical protein
VVWGLVFLLLLFKKHPMRSQVIGISGSVLTWYPWIAGGNILPAPNQERPYTFLKRAERFLSSDDNDDRADCLGNLRRALTHRLQALESIYDLRKAVGVGPKRHFLEILTDIGVVRPTLLRVLLDARNAVEYDDRKPPPQRRCRELVDAVWYFLRTTDSFVVTTRTEVDFSPDGRGESDGYWLSFRFGRKLNSPLNVNGWLDSEFLSSPSAANAIPVRASKLIRKADHPAAAHHPNRKDDDLAIHGVVIPQTPVITSIVRAMFAAAD